MLTYVSNMWTTYVLTRNFGGRGNDVTDAVNGESIWWTKSSRSLGTCPLSAFIMKSIHSFIICISATMWGGAIFVANGRLVSYRSCLLGALLPSGPSWFLFSTMVPCWSSSWVLSVVFFWHKCSSRSWFCLVRHSTVAARVWTCLSRAVVHNSSPWLLVVVAIERVSTMQLFVRKVSRYDLSSSISHRRRQLMMPKIIYKSHSPHVLKTIPAQH